ncbi:secretory lipase-domain-containing protein [Aspergillus coremiiformis]|uniref:Secretory lipase-domain-containing protein n=1 Tax=Aspergillus coremiiformis TaxID=138285 RepID=A0A5N6Z9J6_9EURO|nr:secretory lipase-domain-containing protein [Aspergillus coremiiformis]
MRYFPQVAVLTAGLWSAVAGKPLPPTQDPWYDQPANIASYAPGQTIRSRQLPNQLSPFLPISVTVSVASVHQFLFRTTDSLGNPVAAVNTLIQPQNADPSKLLAYALYYDSSNPACEPSYTLQPGSDPAGLPGIVFANTTLSSDSAFLAASLNQGWWIVTTDYEGLNADFSAGIISGQATLDGVRGALIEGPKLGLSKDARYAMWGYSGGSIAVNYAAELQPTYAPELNFVGAAAGGNIANLSSALGRVNKGPYAGLAFGSISGLSKAYPNVSEWLDRALLPEKKAEFDALASSCLVGELTQGFLKDIYSFFVKGEASFEEDAPQTVMRLAGQMGIHGTPKMPMYIYKPVNDEISPGADTDELVDTYCQGGATVEYTRDLIGGHGSLWLTGSANAMGWIADRLNGKPVSHPGSCTKQDVLLSALNPDMITYFGEELWTFLKWTLGGILGPL